MDKKDKERVASALAEKSRKIKVGVFTFRMKPMTFAQMYEVGAVGNDIDASDLIGKDKVNIVEETMKHYKDAKEMPRIFLIYVFRSKWKRTLFRRYIYKRLTVNKFHEAMAISMSSFDANFFLTSIISLSQIKKMTEPIEMTPHGHLSEE